MIKPCEPKECETCQTSCNCQCECLRLPSQWRSQYTYGLAHLYELVDEESRAICGSSSEARYIQPEGWATCVECRYLRDLKERS